MVCLVAPMRSMQATPKTLRFLLSLYFILTVCLKHFLVNTYAGNAKIYGHTLINLDDKSLASDLSSDRAQTAQWEKTGL